MKKILIAGISIALSLCSGCEHLKKKKPELSLVEHQSYTARLIGYRLTVEQKASVSEMEQFCMDPANIIMSAGEKEKMLKIELTSGDKFEKIGDTVEFKFELAGISLPAKVTLVYLEPGKELWYLAQAKGIAGIMRFKFKELTKTTKVTREMEIEITDTFLRELTELVDLQKVIAKAFDQGTAIAQAHFDPALKTEELVEKGFRGEFYQSFWQAHQASVLINAPPEQVWEFLRQQEQREMIGEMKYEQQCTVQSEIYYCPISLDWAGFKINIDIFAQNLIKGKNYSNLLYAVWLSNLAKLVTELEPEAKGTRLRMILATELPGAATPEMTDLMITLTGIPEQLEKALLEIKIKLEGAG